MKLSTAAVVTIASAIFAKFLPMTIKKPAMRGNKPAQPEPSKYYNMQYKDRNSGNSRVSQKKRRIIARQRQHVKA